MATKDLFTSLKSITRPKSIKAYKDKAVAIDGHCWLRQGA